MSFPIIESLKQNGLPPWLHTWKAVATIAIAGPIMIMLTATAFSVVGDQVARLLPADESAPRCHLSNRDPITPGTKQFDYNHRRLEDLEIRRKTVVERFQSAATDCRPQACRATARKEFRDAARGYIGARASAQESMLSWYGDDGLLHATVIYGETVDETIVVALRERYAAGLFDLDNLRGIEAAARMLLFRPTTDFNPCRAK